MGRKISKGNDYLFICLTHKGTAITQISLEKNQQCLKLYNITNSILIVSHCFNTINTYGKETIHRDCNEKNDTNVFVRSDSHGDFFKKCIKYTVIIRFSTFK